MSENPMGFGAPAPELPQEAPAVGGRDPKVLIGGGIGLAVVALVGGYLLLGGGGGGSSTPTGALPKPALHSATVTPSASAAPVGKATQAVRTFNGEVGRDPFKVLITAAPAPTTTTTAAKPTATVPVAATTSPGSVVGVPTTGANGLPTSVPTAVLTLTPTTTAAPTTTAPPVMVVLKAIAFHGTTPYVVVSFSGKSLAMKTGDTSTGNLKVVAIAPDDGTATFQLGDQTFDLHIGQSYVD
jgi:hypothetical protein